MRCGVKEVERPSFRRTYCSCVRVTSGVLGFAVSFSLIVLSLSATPVLCPLRSMCA